MSSLYTSPQSIPLTPGSSAQFTLTSPTSGLATTVFTPAISGQVSFAQLSGDNTVQLWSVTALADAFATTPVAITNSTAGEVGFLNVTIAPAVSNVPGGYTSLSLIQMVRGRTNEPNLPTNANIIMYANDVVEDVQLELGSIRLVGTYPTGSGQTLQSLTADVQEVISCSWSTGPLTQQGVIVYPMFQYDQGSYMDLAAGFPAVGFGPPQNYTVYQDTANVQILQMYPAAQVGQLNVYYYGRPTLWTLNNNGGNGIASNLDTAFQSAVILGTIISVLDERGRSDEGERIWTPRYEKAIERLRSASVRRTAPKSGQVRDVVGRGYPAQWLSR